MAGLFNDTIFTLLLISVAGDQHAVDLVGTRHPHALQQEPSASRGNHHSTSAFAHWEVVQLAGLQILNLAILVRVQASQPISPQIASLAVQTSVRARFEISPKHP